MISEIHFSSKIFYNIAGTETPVIGVISQTLEKEMHNDTRFQGYSSYIMKSYVDWIEA